MSKTTAKAKKFASLQWMFFELIFFGLFLSIRSTFQGNFAEVILSGDRRGLQIRGGLAAQWFDIVCVSSSDDTAEIHLNCVPFTHLIVP